MATEAQLRRRIQELREDIDSQNRQRERFRNEVIRQTKQQMRQFEIEYQEALQRNKQETDEAYAAKLKEYQESMARTCSAAIGRLEEQMERIAREQAEKIAELDACSHELKRAFETVKSNLEREQELFRDRAQEAYESLLESKGAVEKQPHEFFCAGQYSVITEQMTNVERDIQSGMFQAAISDANGIALDYDLLRMKVAEAFEGWKKAYHEYQRIIIELHALLENYKNTELVTCAGKFKMSPGEMNFWSVGEYRQMAEKIEAAYETVQYIDQTDLAAFLKEQKKIRKDDILKMLTEAKRCRDHLAAVLNCITSERVFSDERMIIGEQLGDLFVNLGYDILSEGFRGPTAKETSSDWYIKNQVLLNENPMDSYVLRVAVSGSDPINICIVPVREYGLTVRNECIVTVETQCLADTQIAKQMESVTEQRIHSIGAGGNLRVNFMSAAVEERENVRIQEQRRKKEASPKEQLKRLERKYQ